MSRELPRAVSVVSELGLSVKTFEEMAAAQLSEFLNRGIALAEELAVAGFRRAVGKSGSGERAAFEAAPQQQYTVQQTASSDGLLRVART